MDEIVTWADVHAEIARARVEKQAVGKAMGYSKSEFATEINTRASIGPSPEWWARFLRALAEQQVKTA